MKKLSLFLLFTFGFGLPSLLFAQSSLEKNLDSFQEVKLGGSFKVYLTNGSQEAIKVSLDKGEVSDLDIEVSGNTLSVSPKKGARNVRGTLWITYNSLSKVHSSGACDIATTNKLVGERLEVSCSGSGNLDLEIEVAELNGSFSGSANLALRGSATRQTFSISGSGKIAAMDCASADTELRISGSGNAQVHTTNSLEARVSGSGNIKYKGNPTKVNTNISGSGNVSKVE